MAHVSKQAGFKCSGVIRTKLSNSTAVLLKQVLHAQSRVHSEMVASFHTFHFPSKMLLEKTKEIKSGENLVRN